MMLTVKMLRDATIPGVGHLSKHTKVTLTDAQAEYVVNRGYAQYLTPPVEPTVQMVSIPVKLKEERREPLVINKDTQKDAPPLLPVGDPEDNESQGSRKFKKQRED